MMGFGRQTPILESGFAAALVRTYRFRHKWPMGLLSFRCLFRQLSPLKRSHGQQGASSLGIGEFDKPIALRRFVQAIFTGFHLPHPPFKEAYPQH